MPGIFTAAAFFDVDETLLTVKSMLRFLEFRYQRLGLPPERFQHDQRELARLAASSSRENANRAYYRLHAGADAVAMTALGKEWFASAQRQGGLFNEPVLQALRRHQAAGHMVVLVSGSFPACTNPAADFVRADQSATTMPVVKDRSYTGEVWEPMIGPAKATAIRSIMAAHSLDPAACYAYADHESDLPMLECVGHPVVIGMDPVLAESADAYGWQRLPAAHPLQERQVL